MKCFILGATGQTGKWVLDYLLRDQHQVTAYVRSPQKLKVSDSALHIIQGDIHDQKSLAQAMKGHDVVISCLGSSTTKKTTELEDMAKSIIAAMKESAVPKIVYMATAGIEGEFTGVFNWFISMILGNVIVDHRLAVKQYKNSGLTYVIARPLQLKNHPPSGDYHCAKMGLPSSRKPISRGNVADFLINAATSTQYDMQSISLAE